MTLHYSEALVRRAVKAFWWRRTGWSYFLAFSVVLVNFALLIWSGDRSWKVGLLGTVFGIAVVAAALLYVMHYRASIARFRRMKKPEATLEVGKDRFRVVSDVGSTEITWCAVTELWCLREFWLLFFSESQFMTLPTADLDSTAREFIVTRLASHGVKISPVPYSHGSDSDILASASSRQAVLDAFDDPPQT